jgi:SAM-dependent methyltransferase
MLKNYWDNFYKNKKPPISESSFARFTLKKIKSYKYKTFDIGCGNGRDTAYFNQNKINCEGIDKSKKAISKNKKKYRKFNKKFLNKDFSKFFKKKFENPFIIYSRFTWHSINYLQEKRLIESLKRNEQFKYIFIEARTINDNFYGEGKNVGKHEFVSTHYRRFIDPKILKKKLSSFMKIIYFKEGKNLAKYKKENPWVLRIIAKVI